MNAIFRIFARRHHRAIIRDCDAFIAHCNAQLAALPAAIANEEARRRQAAGRLATLAEKRPVVNWNLGRVGGAK